MLSTQRFRSRWILAIAFAIYGSVVLSNAWLSDDIWITLRTVDNFVHGYGLTWNVHERVQVYTHPLWTLLLSVFYAAFDEGGFTTLAVSIGCSSGVLATAWFKRRKDHMGVLCLALLFVSSKAFIDYSTSGLENPLTHLFAALFFAPLFARRGGAPTSERQLTAAVLLVSFAYVNRADTILVYAPTLLWLSWRALPFVRWRALRAWAVGMLPAATWTVFAVVYYGFPVPNTAFAKLAGGHYHAPLLHPNSIAYFVNSLLWDPATLPVVLGALLVGGVFAVRRRRLDVGAALLGVLLLLVYALRIGGDYMSGRLFALPFLVSCLVLVETVDTRKRLASCAVVLVVGIVGPRSPIRFPLRAENHGIAARVETGIIDDHLHHDHSSLSKIIRRGDYAFGKARRSEIGSTGTAVIWGATGYFGFENDRSLRTIDNLALSDALLARLPARHPEVGWGRGHLFRDVPAGYVVSVETGQNRITDPSLRAYYDKLLIITTGPLLTKERAMTIWEMNTGAYTHWIDEYEARRRAH